MKRTDCSKSAWVDASGTPKVIVKGNPEYDRYIHSAAWREKADRRLEADSHVCQVCGSAATDVHHLTYDRFGHEDLDDLASLCRKCHQKAEEIYDPCVIPWAMDEVKPEGNNFMAAMRTDAVALAPVVFDWLKKMRGAGFDALMGLRQPNDAEGKKYWSVLKRAVDALCRKRYSRNCVEDRTDMMIGTIANRVTVICLQQIEHYVRNAVQTELHETVMLEYDLFGKWKDVAADLGVTNGTLQTLRRDDGTSFGPSLREAVLHYCGLDAAAGIRPLVGFRCLTDEDYTHLNKMADYVISVSGTGRFKGDEYA